MFQLEKQLAQRVAQKDLNELSIGLHAGKAGMALYLAYYARHTDQEQYLDKSMELLQDCFSRMNEADTNYTLCSGIAGTTWVLAHLARHDFIDAEVDETLKELDDFLLKTALEDIAEGQYDLLHSGLGLGVYFLERWLGGQRDNSLSRIIESLNQARVPDHKYRSWPYNFSHNKGEGSFNLGLAHGVPSIIGFLANCLAAGVPYDGLSELLEESVEWLLKQEIQEDRISCFATCMINGQPDTTDCRLAWCYGDLGIAATLLLAARASGRSDWKEAALRIMRKATQRPVDQSGVKDAGFCHGTAGIAYIFQKFHRAGGEDVFAQAAQYWYEETRRWQKADTLSGYEFWTLIGPKETDMGWKEDVHLLDGLAGVGMAFLAEKDAELPMDWDRCFLLS